MHRKIQIVCASLCTVFLAFAFSSALAQQGTAAPSDPLVQLLESKGILNAADVASIEHAGSAQAANQKLTDILLQHGVISQSEHDQLTGQGTPTVQAAAPAPPARIPPPPTPAAQPQPSIAAKAQNIQAPPYPTEPGAPSIVERIPSKEINAVLVPIRLPSIVLGTTTPTGTMLVLAPQRPVRAQGGFTQLGIPLSRIFNANPAGRNAG